MLTETLSDEPVPVPVPVPVPELVPSKKPIKHIVLSGGGIIGLTSYGILRDTHRDGRWSFDNIESIYGTSIGAVMSAIIAMQFSWDELDVFFTKRPWHTVFPVSMFSVMDAVSTRGMYDVSHIAVAMTPLLLAKDMNTNVTLSEFFQVTRIHLHVFAVEINEFQLVDISHITHPDWRLIDALYASCALPLLFRPAVIAVPLELDVENDKDLPAPAQQCCYVDGGILANYPIHECLATGVDPMEVLGITRTSSGKRIVDEHSNLFEYLSVILSRTLSQMRRMIYHKNAYKLGQEYLIPTEGINIYKILQMFSCEDERKQLLNAFDIHAM
jgi:predicted acylesterase/phospholipase RssA